MLPAKIPTVKPLTLLAGENVVLPGIAVGPDILKAGTLLDPGDAGPVLKKSLEVFQAPAAGRAMVLKELGRVSEPLDRTITFPPDSKML